MKKYIDYFQDSHDIPAGIRFSNELPYPHDVMLREILVELERQNTEITHLKDWIEMLKVAHFETRDTINARIAKLEERLELWESIPQTFVVEKGDAVSTDNINPFTPPGPLPAPLQLRAKGHPLNKSLMYLFASP